jgi:hypothetical protein
MQSEKKQLPVGLTVVVQGWGSEKISVWRLLCMCILAASMAVTLGFFTAPFLGSARSAVEAGDPLWQLYFRQKGLLSGQSYKGFQTQQQEPGLSLSPSLSSFFFFLGPIMSMTFMPDSSRSSSAGTHVTMWD